jgi:Glycosyl transferase 4-like domain
LRLCIVEPDGYGGLIHFSFELCQALADAGHEVRLITDQNYELDDKPHRFSVQKFLRLWNPVTVNIEAQRSLHARAMRIVRRGFRAAKLSFEWARLTGQLVAHKPDAIIFSEILFPHLAIFLWIMRKRGLTLSQVCHEFEYQEREGASLQLRTTLSRFTYRQFNVIFFLSHATRAAFLARRPPIQRSLPLLSMV